MNQPGTNPKPTVKALLNLAKEISDEIDVSNIQMMNGINKNISAPLTRCKIDTIPATGKR
jgi:hypothetical protein